MGKIGAFVGGAIAGAAGLTAAAFLVDKFAGDEPKPEAEGKDASASPAEAENGGERVGMNQATEGGPED